MNSGVYVFEGTGGTKIKYIVQHTACPKCGEPKPHRQLIDTLAGKVVFFILLAPMAFIALAGVLSTQSYFAWIDHFVSRFGSSFNSQASVIAFASAIILTLLAFAMGIRHPKIGARPKELRSRKIFAFAIAAVTILGFGLLFRIGPLDLQPRIDAERAASGLPPLMQHPPKHKKHESGSQ